MSEMNWSFTTATSLSRQEMFRPVTELVAATRTRLPRPRWANSSSRPASRLAVVKFAPTEVLFAINAMLLPSLDIRGHFGGDGDRRSAQRHRPERLAVERMRVAGGVRSEQVVARGHTRMRVLAHVLLLLAVNGGHLLQLLLDHAVQLALVGCPQVVPSEVTRSRPVAQFPVDVRPAKVLCSSRHLYFLRLWRRWWKGDG